MEPIFDLLLINLRLRPQRFGLMGMAIVRNGFNKRRRENCMLMLILLRILVMWRKVAKF